MFGNASSVHHFGQQAKAALDDARSAVAALLHADPSEIVFTSGGTESDNFAIRGAAEAIEPTGRRVLDRERDRTRSGAQHAARARAPRLGGRRTFRSIRRASRRGPRARELVTDKAALVSVMHANNEIGTIQPIADIAAAARERGALMHTDAVQSVGKIPVDVRALGVDLLSLSAHKFNGPKGAGVLWIKRGTRLHPILTGGKHERNRRAGTENVPAIAGMGVAAALAAKKIAGGRRAPRRACAIVSRRASSRAVPGTAVNGAQERARAEHDQHQLRPRRGGEPADRARSRRHRGVDRLGLLVGHARAVARPARDGPVRRIARRTRCVSASACSRPKKEVDLRRSSRCLPRDRREAPGADWARAL